MNKVAIFGKPGSGKSTLSKSLARETGLALYQLDTIAYQSNGQPVDQVAFDDVHDQILQCEHWIIDGFGSLSAFHKRLEAADTLIYINLPYLTCYWLVTKRLIKGLFVRPDGWPKGSSVVKGSIQCYKTLRVCPMFWNDGFDAQLADLAKSKKVYTIRSTKALRQFVCSDKRLS